MFRDLYKQLLDKLRWMYICHKANVTCKVGDRRLEKVRRDIVTFTDTFHMDKIESPSIKADFEFNLVTISFTTAALIELVEHPEPRKKLVKLMFRHGKLPHWMLEFYLPTPVQRNRYNLWLNHVVDTIQLPQEG